MSDPFRSTWDTPETAGCGEAVTRVIKVDPNTDSRWEAFVIAHPDGLIYHHPAWLKVLEQVTGCKPVCLACEDADGQFHGVLPLFSTRGLLTGSRLSSLPHTPVAGPLTDHDEPTAALVRAAVEWVQGRPGTWLQLKVPCAGLERLAEDLVGHGWDLTYWLELPDRPEKLCFGNSRNHARIKWAVNKSIKLGVRVRAAETEGELRAWYDLYLDTMRWHCVPPRPYRFFQAAWELLQPRGLMRLLLAEQYQVGQKKLLAGSIFLMCGKTVFYAFNGRRRDDLAQRPNDVIQWQAIQDACRDGFRYYDFGEVEASNQGLAKFKAKWGAQPRRLYRYYYPASHELETGLLRSTSCVSALAKATWRRLPLKTTALLGSRLYRYL